MNDWNSTVVTLALFHEHAKLPNADSLRRTTLPIPHLFVGCLPLTVRMGARHRSMPAGVVQTSREETAGCPGAPGTFTTMGIGEVGPGGSVHHPSGEVTRERKCVRRVLMTYIPHVEDTIWREFRR
jgi:hypothetical protein